MPEPRTAAAVFDQEFLPIRAKLLEIAAAMDRVGRADGEATKDPRQQGIQAAVSTLLLPGNDRAEKIQLIFSRPYDEQWRERLGID